MESKSSHKSDISPPAASKNEVRYLENIFFRLEKHFPHKGVFFTKVTKASIIAFIETKILRPVFLSEKHPLKKCQPLDHSAKKNNANIFNNYLIYTENTVLSICWPGFFSPCTHPL